MWPSPTPVMFLRPFPVFRPLSDSNRRCRNGRMACLFRGEHCLPKSVLGMNLAGAALHQPRGFDHCRFAGPPTTRKGSI